ncbi:DUF2341 domain-containing protein [Methanococcus aeolicus]|uniref:DUF2341 domain-containing protein n=1 Tax=Methanococcus aeolicus TaxID=42879 RepID=UPI0021C64289|nr:DUF2341 domain-containing protein [Methanococcus aeolicus]UXM84436.1 DUF2341 domain-containing protein [Methanococcus aeolicus]
MITKIKSKKGYIITYEAIIVAFIFLAVFYVGSMAYTHNFLTILESKKDIDTAHKSLLLKDYYLKKYSFPGDFYERDNFTNNVVNKLKNNNIKTFDIYSNFSEDREKMYFRIYSNQYDEKLANATIELITTNNYAFNATFDTSNITIYTNVANRTKTNNSLNNFDSNLGSDFTVFNDVVYIPLITLDNNSPNPIGYKAYGSNGDIIYFYMDGVDKNFSAHVLIDNINRFGAYSDWKYASPMSIRNNVNSQLDYAVKIVFDSKSYIEDGEMNNLCNDVRFLDENGNELFYWIEPQTINTDNTIVWVKMNLPPNEYKTIYMLYGNPTATSKSNGENVFELFDNFSKDIDGDGDLDFDNITLWNINFDEEHNFGTWNLFGGDTYANGIGYNYTRLNYSAYNGTNDLIQIYSKTKYNSSYAMKSRVKFYKKYEEWIGFYYGTTEYDRQIISNCQWGGELLRFESSKDNENDIDYSILPMNLYNNWETYEIQRNGSNSVNLIINDDEDKIYQRTAYISGDNMPISFVARKNGYIDIDWVFVRQYVGHEPEVHNNAYDVVFSVNGKIFSKNIQTVWTPCEDITNELKDGLNEIRIIHSNYPVEFNLGNGNGGQFQTITFSPRNISMVVIQ